LSELAGFVFPGVHLPKLVQVVVFLDYQNVYRRARDTFCDSADPAPAGQVDPLELGRLIVSRDAPDRALKQVRVYRGRPASSKDPKTYGAHMRQAAAWERKAGGLVELVTRTLRYPPGWPSKPAEEKGIDVALAVDFVMMASRGDYDVGVLMSTDTDLKPALEAVGLTRGGGVSRCEVAAWQVGGSRSRRLSIRGGRVWCHWLHEEDYRAVADATDYNIG